MSERPQSLEPRLVQAPTRRKSQGRTTTPVRNNKSQTATPVRVQRPSEARHQDPTSVDRGLTSNDAVEGTEAFRNRISEITSFKVVSRVRPFIPEELAEMEGQERRSVVEMTENTTVLLDPKDHWAPKAQFEFDASLWSIPKSHNIVHTFHDTRNRTCATQKDVYEIIAKDLVPHVFDGFNSCILSYGQTGSGKTYTMMGIYNANESCGGDGEEGIIPRVSNDLFLLLNERQQQQQKKDDGKSTSERVKIRVEVSFVEIYMERVRDLLDPALRNSRGNEKLQDARIRLDPYSGPFVEGVTKYQVENWTQCCVLLERGSQHRTTCATAVHNQSSRSHAIYQLTVVQERTIPGKDRYSRPATKTLAGRINLVDLAGSERGGFQDYVKESAAINTSLLALRRCIDCLTDRQNMLIEQARAEIMGGGYYQDRPLPQVPFRDSVLTWLLSDSIGGNARTTMVATLSPLVKNYGDTLATLQWSSKARNLVTLVKMNDQTIVQDGLATHAGDLGNAVKIQRHNLDSLRETLRHKQDAADRLQKETTVLKKDLQKLQKRSDTIDKDAAALVIQRAFRRRAQAKKLKSYEAHHEKMLRQYAINDGNVRNMDELRREAEKKEADANERFKRAQAETDAVAAKMATAEAGREAFEARRRDAESRRDRIYEQMRAEDICQRHKEKIEREVAATNAIISKIQLEKAQSEQRLLDMTNKIAEGTTEEWRRKVEGDKASLEELREKRDRLLQRRDTAIAERNAVRARHAKVLKK